MKKDVIGEPPERLAENEVIAKVLQNRGNTFDVTVSESQLDKVEKIIGDRASVLLVGINPTLKQKIFIKRNGLVVLTLEKLGPHGKINGEITNVVDDARYWQKCVPEWPVELKVIHESETLDLPPISDDEYTSEEEEEGEGEEEEVEKDKKDDLI